MIKTLFLLFLLASTSVFAQNTRKCPDLVVKKVELVTKCSNAMVVMVTIENKGISTVDIPNDKSLVIQAFWSGDPKFNTGDILINGSYVKNFGDYGKSLSPDGTYSMPITVPLKGKTQFTNNLILVVDATFFIEECEEGNNDGFIFVK